MIRQRPQHIEENILKEEGQAAGIAENGLVGHAGRIGHQPDLLVIKDPSLAEPQIAEQSEGSQIVYKALTEISTESGETEDNYLIRSTRLDAGVNIAITETWTDGYLSPGYQANTTVNIINRGTQAAENVLLRIASDPEGENVLAEREIGDARTATLTWYVPFDYDGEE